MKVYLNVNPSRDGHWWHLGHARDWPVVNGIVYPTAAECLASAEAVAKRCETELVLDPHSPIPNLTRSKTNPKAQNHEQ